MIKRTRLEFACLATVVIALMFGCEKYAPVPENENAARGPKPVRVSEADFQSVVLESKLPVLVDFWSARCKACLEMKPALRELAHAYAGRALICELDTESNPKVTEQYAVSELPAIRLFAGGRLVRSLEGPQTKATLTDALNAVIALNENVANEQPASNH